MTKLNRQNLEIAAILKTNPDLPDKYKMLRVSSLGTAAVNGHVAIKMSPVGPDSPPSVQHYAVTAETALDIAKVSSKDPNALVNTPLEAATHHNPANLMDPQRIMPDVEQYDIAAAFNVDYLAQILKLAKAVHGTAKAPVCFLMFNTKAGPTAEIRMEACNPVTGQHMEAVVMPVLNCEHLLPERSATAITVNAAPRTPQRPDLPHVDPILWAWYGSQKAVLAIHGAVQTS